MKKISYFCLILLEQTKIFLRKTNRCFSIFFVGLSIFDAKLNICIKCEKKWNCLIEILYRSKKKLKIWESIKAFTLLHSCLVFIESKIYHMTSLLKAERQREI